MGRAHRRDSRGGRGEDSRRAEALARGLASSAMTHLAVSEHRDGAAVEWMEKVSDERSDAAVSPQQSDTRPSGPRQQALAPGLAVLTDDVLFGDVWRRPELSPRDRSLVTISALIATGKTAQLAGHLSRGLDNGIQPREASGLLAHLAIYSGWPNAVSALDVYEQVYALRNVDTAALRNLGPRLAAPASTRSDQGGGGAVGFGRAEVRRADQHRSVRRSLAAVQSDAPGSQPSHARGAGRGRRRRSARVVRATRPRERADAYSDRGGDDPSRFLRGLGQGDRGDDGGHEATWQIGRRWRPHMSHPPLSRAACCRCFSPSVPRAWQLVWTLRREVLAATW